MHKKIKLGHISDIMTSIYFHCTDRPSCNSEKKLYFRCYRCRSTVYTQGVQRHNRQSRYNTQGAFSCSASLHHFHLPLLHPLSLSLSHPLSPLRSATAVFLAARPAPAGIDASIIRPITDIETAGMTAVVSTPGAILHCWCSLQSCITD